MANGATQALDLALKRVADFVAAASVQTDAPGPGSLADQPAVFFQRRDLGSMFLTADEARGYYEALDALANWAEKSVQGRVSRNAIAGWLQVALLEAHDSGPNSSVPRRERFKNAVGKVRAQLVAEPVRWTVHIPVFGVSTGARSMRLGRLRFRDADQQGLRRVLVAARRINSRTLNTPPEKAAVAVDLKRDVERTFLDATIATIEVAASDAEAARQLAVAEVRDTVDVINFGVGRSGQRGYSQVPPRTERGRRRPTLSHFAVPKRSSGTFRGLDGESR